MVNLIESKFTCPRGHRYRVELHASESFSELYVLDWRGSVAARRHADNRAGRASWESDRLITSRLIKWALASLPPA